MKKTLLGEAHTHKLIYRGDGAKPHWGAKPPLLPGNLGTPLLPGNLGTPLQAVRVMVRHVRVMVRHVYIVPFKSSHVEYP